MSSLRRTIALALLGPLVVAASAAPSAASDRAAGELVVGDGTGREHVVEVDGSLARAARRLERRDEVAYAAPNWIATTAVTPLDQGTSGKPGGWRSDQWSFLDAPGGIRVASAWDRLVKRRGIAGASDTVVAVVDTGIASQSNQRIAAAPDFAPGQFVPGYDFVDDDTTPLDTNGHGTHVAATIGEAFTLNEPSPSPDFLTGIAPGVRLMPVRVLDSAGEGSADDVAAGILWAARSGADVVNVSLQFPTEVQGCADVPGVCTAIKQARRAGTLVVAAAGNAVGGARGEPRALMPAAAPGALGVAATTEHGCLADYSYYGKGTDLLAPGGGPPRPGALRPRCAGDSRPILQLSFACFPLCADALDRFAIRPDIGTSMASAHASGVAALVRSLRVVGRDPKPRRLAARLGCTARKVGRARFYRPGLLDGGRATARRKC